MRDADASERSALFEELSAHKRISFLAAVDVHGARKAAGAGVQPLKVPEHLFAPGTRGASLGGEEEREEDDEEEEEREEEADTAAADLGARSASGRSGRWHTLAPLCSNPTFAMAVSRSPDYAT